MLCEYISNFVASQCSLIIFWVCDGLNLCYWVPQKRLILAHILDEGVVGWMVELKELEASFSYFFSSNLNFAFNFFQASCFVFCKWSRCLFHHGTLYGCVLGEVCGMERFAL